MPDYSQTKIYIIRSRNTDRVYVGATTSTLVKRFSNHNCRFAKGKSQTRAYKVLEHGDCYIELLERYPCLDKDESNAREKYWMRQFDEQRVNKNIPKCIKINPTKNKKEYRKNYWKQWYPIMKEQRLKKCKCPCGGSYADYKRKRHFQTNKHRTWVFNQWSEFNHL